MPLPESPSQEQVDAAYLHAGRLRTMGIPPDEIERRLIDLGWSTVAARAIVADVLEVLAEEARRAHRSPTLWKRMAVVLPGLALGFTWAAWIAISSCIWHSEDFQSKLTLWSWIISGPAQRLWLGTGMELCTTGFILTNLAAIVAHPLRPNFSTGCITALGLIVWFLAGVSLAFAEV
jgi:hypothetical protein